MTKFYGFLGTKKRLKSKISLTFKPLLIVILYVYKGDTPFELEYSP
jgi:hypothetical protein